jgi:hypothetical protein
MTFWRLFDLAIMFVHTSFGVLLSLTFAVSSLIGQSSAKVPLQDRSYGIEAQYDKAKVYQVEVQLEHAGTVLIEYHDKEIQDQKFPIHVKAGLNFYERFIGSPTKPQSVRFYQDATASIQIDQAKLDSKLNPENRLIVSRIKTDTGNKFQFASVNDILQQKELELIKNPGDPLALPAILSHFQSAVGSTWEPDRDALARLLALDRVIFSDVKLELKEADAKTVKLHLIGKLKAEVDDTLTEMAIAGVIYLDPEQRMPRAMRLTINENRRAAQIAPGFQGQTKIDLKIAACSEVPQLTTEALREIAQTKTIRNVLKWVGESGSFELTYDPNWKMITSDEEAAIFRFVDNGDLLTQCSIVRLPSRPANKPLSLTDFESEVAKIISKDSQSRIVQSSENSNLHGAKCLRVLVSGIEEQVPMNWIYYNIAAGDGRQVTFVFMLEEQVVGRVTTAAEKLVDGFAFAKQSRETNAETANRPDERDAKTVPETLR